MQAYSEEGDRQQETGPLPLNLSCTNCALLVSRSATTRCVANDGPRASHPLYLWWCRTAQESCPSLPDHGCRPSRLCLWLPLYHLYRTLSPLLGLLLPIRSRT